MSTAPTMKEELQRKNNKFELFEKLLSFIDTDEEINPVLSGYFCKLFQVLVGNKPREVLNYIYNHPEVLENLVKHIYQKSISEVLIRVLNVSENILDDDNEVPLEEIRQSFIFKVVGRLAPGFGIEDHINAQSLLTEMAD